MKLCLDIDLAAIRAEAKTQIDLAFARRVMQPLTLIYMAKTQAARNLDTQAPFLMAEATRRGLSVEALAALILHKDEEAQAAAMDVEAQRQQALADLDACQSEQAIRALVAAHQI